jgi:conjugal transfer pilus assembly protein TraE
MDIKLYRDRLANAEAKTLIQGVVIVGLVVALIANGFFRRQVLLHVVPVTVSEEYTVSESDASPEYRKQIALTLVGLVANVTPASVQLQHEAFRRYMTPEAFGRLSEALAGDAAYIKQYHLSRVFFPESATVDGERVTLFGQEHRYIGHNKVAEEHRGYQLAVRVRGWRIQVNDLVVGDADVIKGTLGGHAGGDRRAAADADAK